MTTETTESQKQQLRVLLAESDADTRRSIAQHFDGMDGIELVAVEASAADAIIAAYRQHPDVVLLDLTPPDRPAPDTIRHLLRVSPGVSVAVLVDQEEDTRLTPALDAGARESLLKTAPPEGIASLLRRLGPANPGRGE